MSFTYSYKHPKTVEEKFIKSLFAEDLDYGKITRFCEYLGYQNVGEFLKNLISEYDKDTTLNSEELLKQSYPYRLSNFINYKEITHLFFGRMIRSSRISFFEEKLFDTVITSWITQLFRSTEYSISEQKSRLKLLENFNDYLNTRGYSYSVKIIQIAQGELERRIARELFPAEKITNRASITLNDSQTRKIFTIANELVNSNFLEEPVNFSQVFLSHPDVIASEFLVKWNTALSDLCWLIVLIEEYILDCNNEESQALAMIESKFSNKKGELYSKVTIAPTLSRSRSQLNEYSDQIPKTKSNAPILYKIVQGSL